MRCRADRLILRPRCPGQRDAGVGTTPGAEGDGGAKAGAALSGPRRPGPQSSRSVRFRAEIGRVPRRDRFDGGAPGGRGREAGISARVRRRRRRTRAEMSTSTGARPCAGGVPHERRTARPARTAHPARARPAPRGRTRRRTVVPRSTGSYPTPHGRTLKPPYSTTRRRSVRPRAFMYDRASPGTTGPRQRPPAPSDVRPREQRHHRTTLPPHQTPPDPSPPHPDHGHPPRPQAAQHVRPTTTTHHRPRHEPPHRTTTTTNRTRAGTEPNSTRERGGGPPAVTGARRPPPSSAHTIPRIALMGASVK